MHAGDTFGGWLRRRRRMLDLTQQELAQQVACSVVTVRKLEANDLRPSKDLAHRLAHCLEIASDQVEAFVAFTRGVAITPPPVLSLRSSSVQQHRALLPDAHGYPAQTALPASPTFPSVDMGDAPDVTIFHGRQPELAKLTAWIVDDDCRLVSVLGMGGIGKTALTAKLVRQLQDHFAYVIWRSLRNAPPFETLLGQFVQLLSDQQIYQLPSDIDSQLSLLIDCLRQARCLLILDNMETILQEGDHQGDYRSGYTAYGQLIQRVIGSDHQSCLLLTSREKPRGVGRLEGMASSVRTLQLTNLETAAGQLLLGNKGLTGADDSWTALIEQYSGNPLALKIVAEAIRELFDGNIDDFLQEDALLFGGIRALLTQHFERLSALEQAVLIWLAIEREATPIQVLQDNITPPAPRRALLETLQSLSRRSLLEKNSEGFTLQSVVMEYVTDHLIEQVEQEIVTGSIALFQSHALLKAQSKDYIRESQTRLILQPLAMQLIARLGQAGLEQKLQAQLDALRENTPMSGYAGGNVLNLLLHLNSDLKGYDFSQLAIWQAYLGRVHLPDVNFARANLTGTVFIDNFRSIMSVAFSPNDELLAAGTTDGQIRVWQSKDGQPFLTLDGHEGFVFSIAFSPNGKTLASAGSDQTVKLWDIRTGLPAHSISGHTQLPRTFVGHTNSVRSLCFGPNGAILASGSDDQTIRLWDIHTETSLAVLSGHSDGVLAIAYRPDGKALASGSSDRTIRLWDISDILSAPTITTGGPRQEVEIRHGHTNGVTGVAFHPDGKCLASSSLDGTVRLWDLAKPSPIHNRTTSDVDQAHTVLSGHASGVMAIAFSPDGKILASSSDDFTVRLWDVHSSFRRISDEVSSTKNHTLQILQGHTGWVRSLAYSSDGETLLSGGMDQSVRLWDVREPARQSYCLKTLQGHTGWIRSVAFSPSGEILAGGSLDWTIRLWNMQTRREIQTLQGHTHGVMSVAFGPNGKILASGSDDNTVRLWTMDSLDVFPLGARFRTLQGHTESVNSIAFSLDGGILASASDDRTVRLWDVVSAGSFHTTQGSAILRGHTNAVKSVAFSPDGHIIASAGDDQMVYLWDVSSGQRRAILQGHTGWIRSVAFSPDGHIIASGSFDHTVRLWNTQTGQGLTSLQAHTNSIMSVAFSPDGRILASGSLDQTVRLWDVRTWQLLNVLSDHAGGVLSVAFSPDGKTLAASSGDDTVALWDVRSASGYGHNLSNLRSDRPYERMNISGVTGLTEAQVAALKALGAIDAIPTHPLTHSPLQTEPEFPSVQSDTSERKLRSDATTAALIEPLTERELDVLRLLVSHLSGPEIAAHLVISHNTFKTHTRNIYGKLGVKSRAQAVTRARDLQLLP